MASSVNSFIPKLDFSTKEWEDNIDMLKLQYTAIFILFLMLSLGYTTFVQFGDTKTANSLSIFQGLLVFALVIAGLSDFTPAGKTIFGFGGFNTLQHTMFAIGLAVLFGFVAIASNFSITTGFAVSTAETGLTIFITVISAGVVEELLFRGAIFWSACKMLGGNPQATLVAMLFTSLIFAGYHYYVYSADMGMIFSAFLFSMVGIVGNIISKSLGFSTALHIINNGSAIGGIV